MTFKEFRKYWEQSFTKVLNQCYPSIKSHHNEKSRIRLFEVIVLHGDDFSSYLYLSNHEYRQVNDADYLFKRAESTSETFCTNLPKLLGLVSVLISLSYLVLSTLKRIPHSCVHFLLQTKLPSPILFFLSKHSSLLKLTNNTNFPRNDNIFSALMSFVIHDIRPHYPDNPIINNMFEELTHLSWVA